MANYRAAQSPSISLKVTATDVTYNTELTLNFIRGSVAKDILESGAVVRPGEHVVAVAILFVEGTETGIAGATVSFYITAPGGAPGGILTAVTDAWGVAIVDISGWINDIASSKGWGEYSFQARFAGVLPAAGFPGFNASEADSMGYGIGPDYLEAY